MNNQRSMAMLAAAVGAALVIWPLASMGQPTDDSAAPDNRAVGAPVGAPGAADAAHPAGQQAVPVKLVILYTSGVGYFEHFGSVKGNGVTELHFKTAQINDILKSLVLEDLDHGKVSSVTYGSQDPLAHTLKSFEVDLSAAPPMYDLLAQLRGASVTADLPGGAVTGTILSVEKKQKPAEKQVIETPVLNLLLPGGSIRPVELEQVAQIKLDDPKLQQELVKALSAVAAARDQESKPVSIHFSGDGERRVRIGYVVEAPVWKSSYRLVLTDGAKNEEPDGGAIDPAKDNLEKHPAAPEKQPGPDAAPQPGGDAQAQPDVDPGGKLQGWAIVENQTDSDWENVQLSLVSGRPISFVEDLYQPLFVTRPVVEPELYASLRPQNYRAGLDGADKAVLAESEQAERGAVRRFGAAPGAMPMAPAPMPSGAVQAKGAYFRKAMDPTASVSSAASGASIGEFFQYTVPDVSLSRQKSAMIPIITDSIKTTRLSIFNAAVLPDHPLLGARLTNTTGKLLPQGPITVLDGGAYAGDATIEDLPTHQSRLLSYGIDQQLLIHNNDPTQDNALVTGRVVKGVLELTYKQTFAQHYLAQNKGKADRTLLVEHPRHIGWELVQPKKAMETTDNLYRFETAAPAGKTTDLLVREEVVNRQGLQILPMDTSQIEMYLRTGQIPDDVKKALQGAAKLKYAMNDTERQINEQIQSINEITQEQQRIRENMKAVSAASDYYKRLEKELDTQETQLQKLKDQVKTLRQTSVDQRKALEDYLQNLSVG